MTYLRTRLEEEQLVERQQEKMRLKPYVLIREWGNHHREFWDGFGWTNQLIGHKLMSWGEAFAERRRIEQAPGYVNVFGFIQIRHFKESC